ncbi:MAG: GntR family transcriptional regulator, partial [Actinomycetia bacterium]|nr:GntR family transcriptional regulator [Actinomycetes bacterium]
MSRGVVTEAYRRLAEDGQLAGRGRAGTQVVAAPLVAPPPAPPLLPAPAPAPGAGVPAADHAVFGAAPGVE